MFFKFFKFQLGRGECAKVEEWGTRNEDQDRELWAEET